MMMTANVNNRTPTARSIFIPFADKSQQLICVRSIRRCIVSHVLHNYFAQSGD